MKSVAITGVGVVTPLGSTPAEVLRRIEAGEAAARRPTGFDPAPFSCPVCAEIPDFRPDEHVPEPKAVRLMNRDTQLAVAAARLAMRDAGVTAGATYPADQIALYGATGMAGLPLAEVAPLVKYAASDGRFDARLFGAVTLKRVRPVLSFKILSNMPISFVSIFEGLQGPNAVYNPWEGQGAHAIIAGVRAVARGKAACALVGGCDVKTHELAFVALQQHGVFRPWREAGRGGVPGEGAAFLVLEDEQRARARGATVYARVAAWRAATAPSGVSPAATYAGILAPLTAPAPEVVVSADEYCVSYGGASQAGWHGHAPLRDHVPGTASGPSLPSGHATARDNATPQRLTQYADEAEAQALEECGAAPATCIAPKRHIGNLFAAAAAAQVALGAALARRSAAGTRVLANTFGFGSEQAAFLLEAV